MNVIRSNGKRERESKKSSGEKNESKFLRYERKL